MYSGGVNGPEEKPGANANAPASGSEIDAVAEALSRLRGARRAGAVADRPGPPMPHAGHSGGRMAGLARLRMLEALAAASHPLSVSEIGAAIGVDQPRASRLIQQAVDFELARREADPADARRTRVALTEAGARFARDARDERRAAVGTALAGFSPAERADLARLLTRFTEAWPRD